ncbi:MAG: hypothetical protein LBF38_04260 [Deltaproteobacteria bacterium]|nr:hypothetical protein [Deltaproteobacteria bacterium]
MALALSKGVGVPTDIDKALEYWRLAADQNEALALYSLGQAYETGQWVPKDLGLAARYYRRAIKNSSDKNLSEFVKEKLKRLPKAP